VAGIGVGPFGAPSLVPRYEYWILKKNLIGAGKILTAGTVKRQGGMWSHSGKAMLRIAYRTACRRLGRLVNEVEYMSYSYNMRFIFRLWIYAGLNVHLIYEVLDVTLLFWENKLRVHRPCLLVPSLQYDHAHIICLVLSRKPLLCLTIFISISPRLDPTSAVGVRCPLFCRICFICSTSVSKS
jgi:hypothetical protein